MKNKGFTLIELIVVVSVMALLGLIFTDTLINTLRGESKVRVINQVKQNGQVVLDKLSNEIRQAEKVNCIGTNTDNGVGIAAGLLGYDTIVVFKQGFFIRFRFFPPTSTVNGYIERNIFTKQNVPLNDGQTFEDVYPLLCSMPQQLGQVDNITDKDVLNGVSVSYNDVDGGGFPDDPIFKLNNPLAGYSDTVTIKFRGTAGVGAGQAYENTVKEGGILFNTSVQVKGGK